MKSVEEALYFHRDVSILWAAVFMGAGIGLFFSLETDPAVWWAFFPLLSVLIFITQNGLLRLVILAFFWFSLGFSAALVRTHTLNTPFLEDPLTYTPLTGTIVHIEAHPLGLRATVLPHNLPLKKVRIVILDRHFPETSIKRDTIINTVVNLFPPSSAAHPDGYDFRRAAFFEGIGAVGYTVRHVLLTPPSSNPSLIKKLLADAQQAIHHHLVQDFQAQNAAIGLALTLGDKRAVPDYMRQAYASTGIAHLLAISGLHLSIIAGFLFFLIRRGLCFFQTLTLRYNTKKWAAVMAFFFTSFYLALCWGSVSALRAYLMTGLVFLAILLDRQAITLRSVALAAIGILAFWPESLLTPSFQLSFGAVVGIVAIYQATPPFVSDNPWKKGLAFAAGLMVTTMNATIATMPFTLYHFQQLSLYGLWVNALAIPLTSFVLMPLLFCYVILIPLGCSAVLTIPLEQTINLLNNLALSVHRLPFCAFTTPTISTTATLVLTFSLLWMILWKNQLRWLSGLGVFISGILWWTAPQPIGFIDFDKNLFAIKEGDVLLTNRSGERFVLDQWKTYTQAGLVRPIYCNKQLCKQQLADHEIIWNKKTLKKVIHSGYDRPQQNSYVTIYTKGSQVYSSPPVPDPVRVWSKTRSKK